jgi:hypothetical protein
MCLDAGKVESDESSEVNEKRNVNGARHRWDGRRRRLDGDQQGEESVAALSGTFMLERGPFNDPGQ